MDARALASAAADRYGIPRDLFLKQIGAESAFNQNALSPAGAIGLGQLMPGTARELGVDPGDPVQNIDGAARYLRQQFDEFGDWKLALAAYNAGPGAVKKYGGVPPYAETQGYVDKIMGGEGKDTLAGGSNALALPAPDPRERVNALTARLAEAQRPQMPRPVNGIDFAGAYQAGRDMYLNRGLG